MALVDVIILLLLGMGGVVGFKRGFFKQTVMAVGIILVVVLAFIFKNPVSSLLYSKLPFFTFSGFFAGVTALNILVYEIMAFLIVAAVFLIIFRIVLFISSVLESVLNFTIFLGIPSKLLGIVMGIIEAYVWIFVFLYLLVLPFGETKLLQASKYKEPILKKTPVISKYTAQMVQTFNEIVALKDVFVDETDSNHVNLAVLEVMLRNKITTVESLEQLRRDGKLDVPGIGYLLSKYR